MSAKKTKQGEAAKPKANAKVASRFRAVKEKSGYVIESWRNDAWIGALGGLELSQVTEQFNRLVTHGCLIEDTPNYKHIPAKKA